MAGLSDIAMLLDEASASKYAAPAKKAALGLGQLLGKPLYDIAEGAGLVDQNTKVPFTDVSLGDIGAVNDETVDSLRKQSEETPWWADVALDPRTYIPFAGPAKSVASAGARGGAIYGLLDPVKTDESRILNAAKGMATGYVGGKALGVAGKGIEKIAGKTLKTFNALAKKIGGTSADELLAGIEITLANSGLTGEALDQGRFEAGKRALKVFNTAVKNGLTKEQARAAAVFEAHNIPISKADLTQDAAAQAAQAVAKFGGYTEDAATKVKDYSARKVSGITDYLRSVSKSLTGDDLPAFNATDVSQSLAESFRKKVATDKASIDTLFADARKAGKHAYVALNDVKGLRREMSAVVNDMQLDTKLTPALRSNLKFFRDNVLTKAKQHGGVVPWRELSNFRTRLSNNSGDFGSKEALAISKIKGVFDKFNNGLDKAGKIQGDDAALKTITNANAAFAGYKNKYWGRDGKSITGAVWDKKINPDQVIEKIAGKAGLTNTATANNIRHIKSVFGEESPELNMVRGTMLRRMINNTLDDPTREVSGEVFKKNFKKMMTENAATARELFGDEGIALLSDASNAAHFATNIVRDKANPSGSGSMMIKAASSIADMIPGGGKAAQLGKTVIKRAEKEIQGAKVESALDNPIPNLQVTGLTDALKASAVAGATPNALNKKSAASTEAENLPVTKPENVSDELPEGFTIDAPDGQDYDELPDGFSIDEDEQSSLPGHIRDDEGLRYASYLDTTGNRTVGFGFNMDSGIARKQWKKAGILSSYDDVYAGRARISPEEAEALGNVSLKTAMDDALSIYPDFGKYSDSRKEALLNLSYQFGKPRLSKLNSFNTAVREEDWAEAVRHLLKTDYLPQNPNRARRTARKLLRG